MIARSGAMALFVLRLAGLLSLEKSLIDNSTDFSENSPVLPGTSSITFSNPSALVGSSIILTKNATIDGSSSMLGKSSETSFTNFWKSKTVQNEPADSTGTQKVIAGKKVENSRLVKNITTSKKINSKKNSTTSLMPKNNKKLHKNVKTTLANNKNSQEGGSNERKKGTLTGELPIESTTLKNSSLLPRNSQTGFSPLVTKQVNNSELPYFVNAPSKIPFVFDQNSNPRLNNSLLNSSNGSFLSLEGPEVSFVETGFDYNDDYYGNDTFFMPPELTSRSLISPVPRPGEEEAYKKHYEKANGRSEVGDENNITKTSKDESIGNFETIGSKDVERNKDLNQVTVNEKGKKQVDRSDNHEKEGDLEYTKTNESEHHSNNEENIASTISTPYPVHINVSEPKRNNPYPYGPKFIPRQTLVNNKTVQKSINVSDIFGKLFPVKEFLYNYDYDTLNSTETPKEKFFVKTDKPPVLIHFDKPGYSPKLPESSLPPTRAPTPSDPWDCSPRCPRYILLDWNPDYDIRQYPVTTWISTVIIAENRILAELEGYMRVQDYFYGLNDRGKLLNITVPFVTQIKHGQHPGVLKEFTDFTVSLYINHEDDPLNYDLPTPISNEVLIDRLETKTVFVSGFEAFVWEVTEAFLTEKVELLTEKLRQNGEAFLDRYFYLASYNRPELYQPLYYELWIYATTFRDNVALQIPPLIPARRQSTNHVTVKTINKLCRGVECPSFEVLRTYRYGIQKRRYFDGIFVTTSPGVCQFSTLSVWKGFMPLHLYKHGINSHMEVIEATRPIALVHVKEDSTSHTECPQNITMAIYLPKRLHSNPPLTGYDAPRVEVSALQDVVVYAYTVGGYLLEPDRVRKELADLKYRLTEFGACFKNDEYYVVVYDFIVRYHGRQNEIWVVAENCKATKNG